MFYDSFWSVPPNAIIKIPKFGPIQINDMQTQKWSNKGFGLKKMRNILKPMKNYFSFFHDFYFLEKWWILYSKYLENVQR